MRFLMISVFMAQFFLMNVSFAADQALQCEVQESDGKNLVNYNLISQVARNDYETKNTEVDVPSKLIPHVHIDIYSYHSAAGHWPIESVGRIYNDATQYEADSSSENGAPFSFGYESINGIVRVYLNCKVQ